ncbi:MAG: AAA family ATPase [Lachnospiraceae bacterium]|nr:AAA family ATPase [Lachnospiraceae bacterium]
MTVSQKQNYPFTAILGQDQMKEALLLNLINPSLGGVLIRGQKGTAKSTAVRALGELLSETKVVELPLGATEDRVVGTLDVEYAIQTGKKKFEPGILKAADGQILYVDEINLLEDRIVDILLDAAAMGVNTVEREGISYSHPARFALVGTMNPEEGNLRPQLLDRFGLVVDVTGETEVETRAVIIENRLAYEENPGKFRRKYARKQKVLGEQITAARELLPSVTISHNLICLAAEVGIRLETEGHRADISMIKTAKTIAAMEGRSIVEESDLRRAAVYTLPHRMRRTPTEEGQIEKSRMEEVFSQASNREKVQKQSKAEDG